MPGSGSSRVRSCGVTREDGAHDATAGGDRIDEDVAQLRRPLLLRRRDQAVVRLRKSGRGMKPLVADRESCGNQLQRAASRVLAEISLRRNNWRCIAEESSNRLRFETIRAMGGIRRRINSIDIMY